MNKKINNVEITRGCSRKVQIDQFEPYEVFCSAKAVCDPSTTDEEKKQISDELYQFCLDEVGSEMENTKDFQKWFKPQKYVRDQQKKKEEIPF